MVVKLDIYRKFTNALAVAVIVSVGWTCYEVIHTLALTCLRSKKIRKDCELLAFSRKFFYLPNDLFDY